ncbi:hypothetical protein Pcinc_041768 [Petrolisthes cinctipes]|uniref:MSP domain-containing protein n=1 Tax=Petrolisthes cinctipes TaxID=88211 RepID=A0AAE1BJ79_PETCI|nr:hypothetical protein Pcinc_041768 [Petrolisthes cinctipes]
MADADGMLVSHNQPRELSKSSLNKKDDKPQEKVHIKKLRLRQGNVVMQQSSSLDGKLPVFVFPQALTFYAGDHTTHKQILTLYNPYEFRIQYSVLCNNPSCFTVDQPKGFIRAKNSVDMIVTRTNVNVAEASERDRFRIAISEDGSRLVIGKKDVPAVLVKGVPEPRSSGSDSDQFQSVRAPSSHTGAPPSLTTHPITAYEGTRGPSLLLVGGAVICLAGLLLPTQGEGVPTTLPAYLHLHANVKIVLAYALGLLTYAILRPT